MEQIENNKYVFVSLPLYKPKNEDSKLFSYYKNLKKFVMINREDIVQECISVTILNIDPIFTGKNTILFKSDAIGFPEYIGLDLKIRFKIPKLYFEKIDFNKYNYSAAYIEREPNLLGLDYNLIPSDKIVKSRYYFVLFEDDHPFSLNKKSNEQPRENYISWDEYFMGVASLTAMRSKDPRTQVGSCIVRDNKILSTGYNGFPLNCNDSEFPWNSDDENPLNKKDLFVVHSELNAILNYKGDLAGATIYVTLFPCNECAKAIIQSGIKKVVYKEIRDSEKTTASKKMLRAAGVKILNYTQTNKRETIEF